MENRLSARTLAREQEVSGDKQSGLRRTARWRYVRQPGGVEVGLNVRRRTAIGNLPCDLTPIHVVGRDSSVRRPQQPQIVWKLRSSAAHSVGRVIRAGNFTRTQRVIRNQTDDRRVGRRADVDEAGFRIRGARFPVGASSITRDHNGAVVRIRDQRRRSVQGTRRVGGDRLDGRSSQLGRVIDQIVFGESHDVERRWLGRDGLRRRSPLSRDRRLWHWSLDDGPHRLACHAVKDVGDGLFRQLDDSLDRSPVHIDVDQNRMWRIVVIPDVVMDQLVVPDPFTGFDIEADQTAREKIVPRPRTAPNIVGAGFDVQVNVAQFGVDRKRSPDTGVPGVVGRPIQPGVVAELARARNGVESPFSFAGHHVERQNVTLQVRSSEAAHCGADNHGVACDHYRRGVADASQEVAVEVQIQGFDHVDGAIDAEAWNRTAGVRIECNELETGGGEQYTVVALSVGPVGHAPVNLARGLFESLPFIRTVDPERFASARVGRDNETPLVHGEIQDTIDHQWRGLAAGLRVGQQAVGFPYPCDFQVIDVVRPDLVERRVAGAALIAAVCGPFAIGGALLRHGLRQAKCRCYQEPQQDRSLPSRH